MFTFAAGSTTADAARLPRAVPGRPACTASLAEAFSVSTEAGAAPVLRVRLLTLAAGAAGRAAGARRELAVRLLS